MKGIRKKVKDLRMKRERERERVLGVDLVYIGLQQCFPWARWVRIVHHTAPSHWIAATGQGFDG